MRSITRFPAGRAAPRRGASPCARARCRSRCTRRPSSCSISLRAAVPTARTMLPPAPTRIAFCDSVSAHTRARDDEQAVLALLDLVDLDLDRVRQLLARAQQHLLADQLGEPDARPTGRCAPRAGTGTGPPAAARRACSTSSSTPAPLRALTGKISPVHVELGGGRRARRTVRRRSSRSTLFSDGHGRHARALRSPRR